MRYASLLVSLMVAGCALIDQRTFAPSREAEPIPVVRGAPVRFDARTPLVTIDYATPSPQYKDLLRLAVRAAEARNPTVQYDVAVVEPELQAAAPPQAMDIMRAIIAEGVPAVRVHLGMRADPGLSAVQVRVYVR